MQQPGLISLLERRSPEMLLKEDEDGLRVVFIDIELLSSKMAISILPVSTGDMRCSCMQRCEILLQWKGQAITIKRTRWVVEKGLQSVSSPF